MSNWVVSYVGIFDTTEDIEFVRAFLEADPDVLTLHVYDSKVGTSSGILTEIYVSVKDESKIKGLLDFLSGRVRYASVSGAWLVEEGEIHPFFDGDGSAYTYNEYKDED